MRAQCGENAFADRERSECVAEARVLGCGKREIRKAELTQPAQALDGRRIEQRDFRIVERDETMDRIEDAFHLATFDDRGASALV